MGSGAVSSATEEEVFSLPTSPTVRSAELSCREDDVMVEAVGGMGEGLPLLGPTSSMV